MLNERFNFNHALASSSALSEESDGNVTDGVDSKYQWSHQARWMAIAIYAIKILMLKRQFKIINDKREALEDFSVFVITEYFKVWHQW